MLLLRPNKTKARKYFRVQLDCEKPMVKKENTRTCIASREIANRDQLIRFVVGPDDEVVPDLQEKLPGRGVWVMNDKILVQQAIDKKLFASGFKAKVKIRDDLIDIIEKLMLRNIQHGLSIAKKAGLAISGFSKVESRARSGEISVLFHASDGKGDGLEKMKSALMSGHLAGGYKKKIPQAFTALSSSRLDLALGASNCVHIAVLKGGAGASLKMQIRRYESFQKLA